MSVEDIIVDWLKDQTYKKLNLSSPEALRNSAFDLMPLGTLGGVWYKLSSWCFKEANWSLILERVKNLEA